MAFNLSRQSFLRELLTFFSEGGGEGIPIKTAVQRDEIVFTFHEQVCDSNSFRPIENVTAN